MQAAERLIEISETFGDRLHRIIPLELDDETLRIILFLQDGTNLPVNYTVAGRHTQALQLLLADICERAKNWLG